MSAFATHHGSGWHVVIMVNCAEQTGRVRIFFGDGLSLARNFTATDFQNGLSEEMVHTAPVVVRAGATIDIIWRPFVLTLCDSPSGGDPSAEAPPAYSAEDRFGLLEHRFELLERQYQALERRCQELQTKNEQQATLLNFAVMHPAITPSSISAAVILLRYDAPLARADDVIKYIWLTRPCNCTDYETILESLDAIIGAGVSPRGLKVPAGRPTILGTWLARLAAVGDRDRQGIISIVQRLLEAGADPDDPQTRRELQDLDPITQADFARLATR